MASRVIKILWVILCVVIAVWGGLGGGDAALVATYLLGLLTMPTGVLIYVLGSLAIKEAFSVGVRSLYLMGVYDDVGNKKLSKETARAYLYANKHYKKSYVAFENEVPVGTVVTIIGLAPKPWYLFFNEDHYFVKLEPDISQGLEVKLPLHSSMEGSLDGLNPEIFSRE